MSIPDGGVWGWVEDKGLEAAGPPSEQVGCGAVSMVLSARDRGARAQRGPGPPCSHTARRLSQWAGTPVGEGAGPGPQEPCHTGHGVAGRCKWESGSPRFLCSLFLLAASGTSFSGEIWRPKAPHLPPPCLLWLLPCPSAPGSLTSCPCHRLCPSNGAPTWLRA